MVDYVNIGPECFASKDGNVIDDYDYEQEARDRGWIK
jgi:hypothetical protein